MLEEAISRVEAETANKQTIIAPPSAPASSQVASDNKSFFARFYAAIRCAGRPGSSLKINIRELSNLDRRLGSSSK